jgi:hypothetical protein
MEARFFRLALVAGLLVFPALAQARGYRTTNFIVSAPTDAMAKQIGDAAEQFRRELAIDWLGKEMPAWAQPCPITAQVADNLGAGGATSFLFEKGEVYGWRMTIQGSLERILDSVLPHEVTHTVFATHFRQPLPRWADEGACTTVEHPSERGKQQIMLVDFLRTGRGIPFSKMFAMREYPQDVMPLYSQGYSLAKFLIYQGGKHKFLAFVGDGMTDENWTRAIGQHYGFHDLGQLQNSWLDWVRQGSPPLQPAPSDAADVPQLLANTNSRPAPTIRPASNILAQADITAATNAGYPTDDETSHSVTEEAPLVPVRMTRQGSESSDTPAQAVSWQSRQKNGDVARAAGTSSPASAKAMWSKAGPVAAADNDPSTTPGPVNSDSGNYQVTRPQPPQQARQLILEWSRP